MPAESSSSIGAAIWRLTGEFQEFRRLSEQHADERHADILHRIDEKHEQVLEAVAEVRKDSDEALTAVRTRLDALEQRPATRRKQIVASAATGMGLVTGAITLFSKLGHH